MDVGNTISDLDDLLMDTRIVLDLFNFQSPSPNFRDLNCQLGLMVK